MLTNKWMSNSDPQTKTLSRSLVFWKIYHWKFFWNGEIFLYHKCTTCGWDHFEDHQIFPHKKKKHCHPPWPKPPVFSELGWVICTCWKQCINFSRRWLRTSSKVRSTALDRWEAHKKKRQILVPLGCCCVMIFVHDFFGGFCGWLWTLEQKRCNWGYPKKNNVSCHPVSQVWFCHLLFGPPSSCAPSVPAERVVASKSQTLSLRESHGDHRFLAYFTKRYVKWRYWTL